MCVTGVRVCRPPIADEARWKSTRMLFVEALR